MLNCWKFKCFLYHTLLFCSKQTHINHSGVKMHCIVCLCTSLKNVKFCLKFLNIVKSFEYYIQKEELKRPESQTYHSIYSLFTPFYPFYPFYSHYFLLGKKIRFWCRYDKFNHLYSVQNFCVKSSLLCLTEPCHRVSRYTEPVGTGCPDILNHATGCPDILNQ